MKMPRKLVVPMAVAVMGAAAIVKVKVIVMLAILEAAQILFPAMKIP
jgi:hypothetical protein